jgi:predicted ATP-grasp superfamily ATP-dependent carboligase
MGSVALIAAGYLVHELGAESLPSSEGELPSEEFFDLNELEVRDGLIGPLVGPRGIFHRWRNPGGGRELIVFLSEAQPSHRHVTYGNRIVDIAMRLGVERVVTFASLASALHPSENPKVWGVATDASTLEELRRAEVEPIASGQIGGLNGLLLAVAAARGLSGMCFLAEIPFFAMRVPNPKAARAALSVFSVLAGIDVSLDALSAQAAMVDRALIEAMQKMESDDAEEPSEPAESRGPAEEVEPEQEKPALDAEAKARIEQLFEIVRADPSQAVRLKNELDRLGVFAEYEGRFLDLFRRAD